MLSVVLSGKIHCVHFLDAHFLVLDSCSAAPITSEITFIFGTIKKVQFCFPVLSVSYRLSLEPHSCAASRIKTVAWDKCALCTAIDYHVKLALKGFPCKTFRSESALSRLNGDGEQKVGFFKNMNSLQPDMCQDPNHLYL